MLVLFAESYHFFDALMAHFPCDPITQFTFQEYKILLEPSCTSLRTGRGSFSGSHRGVIDLVILFIYHLFCGEATSYIRKPTKWALVPQFDLSAEPSTCVFNPLYEVLWEEQRHPGVLKSWKVWKLCEKREHRLDDYWSELSV